MARSLICAISTEARSSATSTDTTATKTAGPEKTKITGSTTSETAATPTKSWNA
jgi:hypothetical protein